MNCELGDLAMVKRIAPLDPPQFQDAFCTVLAPYHRRMLQTATGEWFDMWVVEFPRPMPWADRGDGSWPLTLGVWPDAWLQPIRNPGKNAVDEMVQLMRDKRAEQAREPDPAYVGQTFYEPTQPPGFVGV